MADFRHTPYKYSNHTNTNSVVFQIHRNFPYYLVPFRRLTPLLTTSGARRRSRKNKAVSSFSSPIKQPHTPKSSSHIPHTFQTKTSFTITPLDVLTHVAQTTAK